MSGNKPGVVLNCRTCTRACKQYKSLQDEIEIGPEGNTTLAHMLNFCSNLSFEPQDGVLMPQHICLPCLQMLQQAFTFKRMVIDSDELLRLGLEEVDGTPTETTGSPVEISPFNTKIKSNENNNDEYVMIEMLSDELNSKRLAKIEIEEDQEADTDATHPEEFLLDDQNSNADADAEDTGDADCMTEDGLDSLTDFQATDIEYVTIETEYDSQAEDDDDIEIMDDSQCLDTVSEQMQIQMLDDQMVILSGEEPIDEVIAEDDAEHLLDIESEEHLLPGDSDDGEEYLDDSRDDAHLIVAGQGGEVLPHVCTVCHKAFRQLCRLNQHMRSHVDEKLHTCEVCGKKLKHLRNYKEHMLTHTNVKPHQCLVCARFYRTTSSLAAHMRTHAEDKPYKCEQCGRSYAAFDHLRRHKLTHTGERPYACDLCDKAYYDSSSLRQHKISHTGEKAFTCEICGVGLSQKSGYKKHMLVHSGEKPHKCHICGRAFTFTSNLNAHVRLHSGEKPFKCDKCMKAFPTKKRLVSHQRVHNKEAPVTTTGAAGSAAHAERIAVVAANRRAALNMSDGMDQVSTSKVVVVL